MLIGPGRWGTTTPSLGVPVSFAEIDAARILCEIVAMREDLVPDVSLGTHFFNDLVEMDMLYLALFPGRQGNSWSEAFFEKTPKQAGGTAARRREMGARGPRAGHAAWRRRRPGLDAQCQRPDTAGGLLPGTRRVAFPECDTKRQPKR